MFNSIKSHLIFGIPCYSELSQNASKLHACETEDTYTEYSMLKKEKEVNLFQH